MRKVIIAGVASLITVLAISGTSSLQALPNSVGGLFINPAGMRFEEFGARKLTWEPNAKLLADWELWTADNARQPNVEVLKLKQKAIVFGLEASEVTVHRKDNQVLKFNVFFGPGTEVEKIEKNIGLWADGKWDQVANTINHGAVTLKLSQVKGGTHVEFLPKQS
ncbi:MAG: hypothetical protein HKN23_02810 [Verrucomicrobiales bacterium]|nr:hypothetical protein [Verrucomicrobiales bacterium]